MLHHGDMLDVLPALEPGCADLIYFDPPFNSGKDYKTREGVLAYSDKWSFDEVAAQDCYRAMELGRLGWAVNALHDLIGPSPAMAYLAHVALCIAAIEPVLSDTGSLYLHCDPKHSHHIRLLLDAALGADTWRNTITWRYRRWPTKAHRYQRMHDDILFYARDGTHFEALYGYESLASSTLQTFGDREQVADFSTGHRKPGKTQRKSKGPPLSDVWEVGVVAPSGHERTGYPTQKPEKLLERIILSSTKPGDTVLDPACGSGTTPAVAERLGRKWIAIDRSAPAIETTRTRLAQCTQAPLAIEL